MDEYVFAASWSLVREKKKAVELSHVYTLVTKQTPCLAYKFRRVRNSNATEVVVRWGWFRGWLLICAHIFDHHYLACYSRLFTHADVQFRLLAF